MGYYSIVVWSVRMVIASGLGLAAEVFIRTPTAYYSQIQSMALEIN